MSHTWKALPVSHAADVMLNPLRHFIERLKPYVTAPVKPLIQLSVGDPTLYGNLKAPANVLKMLCDNAVSCKYNGYAHQAGLPDARAAIAQFFTLPNSPLTPEDVFITSSCSGALEIVLRCMCNPGANVLLPAPGFSLYQTICNTLDVESRFYRLRPEKDWEIDLAHLASLADDKTVAILINNPSNPCGSVFTRKHLEEIVAVANRLCLPIISDEIYFNMTFPGPDSVPFTPIAAVSDSVPIIAVAGLAKRYLVPGWRVGWAMVHDRNGHAHNLRDAIGRMCALLLGANTVAQSVIREALFNTPEAYYENLMSTLGANAQLLCKSFSEIPELTVVMPRGAMYMMLGLKIDKFKDIPDDTTFVELLLKEEAVFLLPGTIFKCPNFVRLVISAPIELLHETAKRIAEFCARHRREHHKHDAHHTHGAHAPATTAPVP